jgi:hypothetical protein
MLARDFCFWLQGYLEITREGDVLDGLTKKQIECVQKHLALVFKHEIDPSEGSSSLQEALNKIHEPRPQPPGDPPGHSHGEPGHVIYRC